MATQKIYSAEESEQRYKALPSTVQDFLYGPEILAALEKIGAKYNLHVDQIGSLQTEASGVILGFTEPQDFHEMIVEALHVPDATAEALAHDIDIEVLQRVRKLIQQSISSTSPVGVTGPSAGEPLSAPASSESWKGATIQPSIQPASSSMSSADTALVQPTENIVQTVEMSPDQTAISSPEDKKYAVDPYHEPVE